MSIEHLLIYSVVSFFYIISPGPAIFLAISNGMTADTKAVAMSSLGNISGLLVLSSVSILGLGALIIASSSIFFLVKLFGATYLIYLGIKHWRVKKSELANHNLRMNAHRHLFSYYREGFLLAVTNPKAIVFFSALFPQFLNLEAAITPQFLIMTSLFMTLSFGSLFSYGYVSKAARHLLASERRMMWFHRITGGLFISMGLGLLRLKNSHG